MATTKCEIRRGAYYDSVVLMQLQSSLTRLPGIHNAGAMMGTEANKAILAENGLLPAEARKASPEDLIISISAADDAAARAALEQVDTLLAHRSRRGDQAYTPKSLESAMKLLPEAGWVLVSVPGRYAEGVTRTALQLEKNVFLYSDNVPLEAEVRLKKEAAAKGLMIMGPDCGTAIINGMGFGFANRVRRGPIGVVGAAGTGLQQVTSRIHQLGSGISHAFGTGSRDLFRDIGGITAQQGLDLLGRDPDTKVIVLISKPPAREVTGVLLGTAAKIDKPVVIDFIGHPAPPGGSMAPNLHFATSLDDSAELAVKLAAAPAARLKVQQTKMPEFAATQKYLRGLFSGGTLAYECLISLQNYLPDIYSNIALQKEYALPDPQTSRRHTLLDLGDDAFTVGRPHPMLDNSLRLERLAQEARDPEVALILLDVVLGDGAHPDPAAELAPAIHKVREAAQKEGRSLEIVAIVVGTEDDPQDMAFQIEALRKAGARVETSAAAAATYAGTHLRDLATPKTLPVVDLQVLHQPLAAINVGLASFADSLTAQGAEVVHVDWRPPAGGDAKLMSILARMKT